MSKSKTFLLTLAFLFLFGKYSISQSKAEFQVGYSYLEHLSTGIGLKFKENHKIMFLLGTNLFTKMNNFAVYQIQYENLNQLKRRLSINYGIKAGFSNFANNYYKWQLVTITPISSLNYRFTDALFLTATLGLTYSKVLKVKRVEFGEIGWYRLLLPEFKLALEYEF
jgi:hypothetical protein